MPPWAVFKVPASDARQTVDIAAWGAHDQWLWQAERGWTETQIWFPDGQTDHTVSIGSLTQALLAQGGTRHDFPTCKI